jgi:hypothetical protein
VVEEQKTRGIGEAGGEGAELREGVDAGEDAGEFEFVLLEARDRGVEEVKDEDDFALGERPGLFDLVIRQVVLGVGSAAGNPVEVGALGDFDAGGRDALGTVPARVGDADDDGMG